MLKTDEKELTGQENGAKQDGPNEDPDLDPEDKIEDPEISIEVIDAVDMDIDQGWLNEILATEMLALTQVYHSEKLQLKALRHNKHPDAKKVGDHMMVLQSQVALIQSVGSPIVGTSANLSGKPSPLTAEGVRSQLNDKVDFVIDGRCPGGRESTVVDVTGETPVILREGAISREEIARVCGDVVLGQEAR